MGKRGPACSICTHAKRGLIEAMLIEQPINHVASRFQLSVGTVGNHKRNCPKLKPGSGGKVTEPPRVKIPAPPDSSPPPPMPPILGAGENLESQMRAHAVYISKRLQWETLHGDAKAIAALSGQFTNAQRHLAKLTGALEVSEAQIVRSPKFVRLLGLIQTALGDDTETWARVRRAVELYETGESGVVVK